MTTLCDEMLAPGNLTAAWRRYRGHRGLWSPGAPMNAVRREPVEALLRLADDLRCGRYRPLPPTVLGIAKADGSLRKIAVYALRDRVAQRALTLAGQARTDAAMSPLSFGFRPGRGVAQAQAAAQRLMAAGHWWAVDADIEQCFDRLPRARLLDCVARRTGDAAAAELVARLLGWPSGRAAGCGVPQGACIAPWLCNLLLWDLDDAAAAEGLPMLRYADDLLLPLASQRQAQKAMGWLQQRLVGLELRLHPLKSRICCLLEPVTFLGRVLQVRPLLTSQGQAACAGSGA